MPDPEFEKRLAEAKMAAVNAVELTSLVKQAENAEPRARPSAFGLPSQRAKHLDYLAYAFIFVLRTDAALAFGLIAVIDGEVAALVLIVFAPPSS